MRPPSAPLTQGGPLQPPLPVGAAGPALTHTDRGRQQGQLPCAIGGQALGQAVQTGDSPHPAFQDLQLRPYTLYWSRRTDPSVLVAALASFRLKAQ